MIEENSSTGLLTLQLETLFGVLKNEFDRHSVLKSDIESQEALESDIKSQEAIASASYRLFLLFFGLQESDRSRKAFRLYWQSVQAK